MSETRKKLNRIKAVLADQGKTNTDLSKALDRNRTSVSRWCTNESQPSLETLFEIAEYLKVDVCELIAKK